MYKILSILFFVFAVNVSNAENFPPSDHYNGNGFFNLDSSSLEFWDILKWQFDDTPRGIWIKNEDFQPQPAPPKRVYGSKLLVTWVNHSTVLIQTNGLNILTDPVWSETIGPISFLNPARFHPPGIKFEDLPPIDVVLISHNHYDHFDIPTIKMLIAAFNPKFIVPLGLKEDLISAGSNKVYPLDWWSEVKISDSLSIFFVPARHYSMRGLFDSGKSLWGGYVIKATGGYIYFAGDTGFGKHFKMIYDKFGPMRFSLIPISPYQPNWVMRFVHISPMEAVEVHKILHSETSMAIHFGTFRQGDDGQQDCQYLLKRTLKNKKIKKKAFFIPDFGNEYVIDN